MCSELKFLTTCMVDFGFNFFFGSHCFIPVVLELFSCFCGNGEILIWLLGFFCFEVNWWLVWLVVDSICSFGSLFCCWNVEIFVVFGVFVLKLRLKSNTLECLILDSIFSLSLCSVAELLNCCFVVEILKPFAFELVIHVCA